MGDDAAARFLFDRLQGHVPVTPFNHPRLGIRSATWEEVDEATWDRYRRATKALMDDPVPPPTE